MSSEQVEQAEEVVTQWRDRFQQTEKELASLRASTEAATAKLSELDALEELSQPDLLAAENLKRRIEKLSARTAACELEMKEVRENLETSSRAVNVAKLSSLMSQVRGDELRVASFIEEMEAKMRERLSEHLSLVNLAHRMNRLVNRGGAAGDSFNDRLATIFTHALKYSDVALEGAGEALGRWRKARRDTENESDSRRSHFERSANGHPDVSYAHPSGWTGGVAPGNENDVVTISAPPSDRDTSRTSHEYDPLGADSEAN
jgi:hypothetical protein